MKQVQIKALISLILLSIFFIVVITGIGLALAPAGRIAHQTNWTFLGLDKHHLETMHTRFGFFFAFLVVIHFLLNWRMLKSECRSWRRRN